MVHPFRFALLSFFFLSLSIPISPLPLQRHLRDQVRQALIGGILRHEDNRQIPQAINQISVNQTATDHVANSTTNSTTNIKSTTTLSPTTTFTTTAFASINSSGTLAITTNSPTTGTTAVNLATTSTLIVSSNTEGGSAVIATTTVLPTVTSVVVGTSVGTSSFIGTTDLLRARSTAVGTSPTIASTTAILTVTQTAAGIFSVNAGTTVVPTVSSKAPGTSPVVSATTATPTVTSAAIDNSSIISTTIPAPIATFTTVALSTVSSVRASTPIARATPPLSTNTSSRCQATGASPSLFRMNVGGGVIAAAAMAAENTNYMDSKGQGGISISDATNITSTNGPTPWDEAYLTYRWIAGSVLRYRIPVKRGTYIVKLLFAESIHTSANARQFDVFINGVQKEHALDVYALVGKNVGLLKEYTNIKASALVEIALIKVVDHPLLSGIMIEGTGAGAKAVGGGCSSPADDELEFNNGFDHRAHAVPDGPYIVTDLEKIGSALVSLDGTLSHSHYSDPVPPEVSGRVVSYKWTWTEIVNGSEVVRENKDKSGKFRARFPVGRTLVTLEVVDNTGDSSSDYAEVDVKPSTKQGAYCYGYTLGNASMPSVPDLSSLDFLQERKPQYGNETAQLAFSSVPDFGKAPLFEGSFMYRCTFFLSDTLVGERNISMRHDGPFVLYQAGSVVAASDESGETDVHLTPKGLQECEVLYFRDARVNPMLELRADGALVAAAELSHDESEVVPVISHLSETESAPTGGGNIKVCGSGFVSDVKIFFGEREARDVLRLSSERLQVRIPRGESGEVMVSVQTRVAVSNGVKFEYADRGNNLEQPIIFETTHLQHQTLPKKQDFPLVASIVYGPDFRLYLGTYSKGHIHAVAVGPEYRLNSLCTHNIGEGRSALGLAFSPFSNRLRLFFSSSTVFWKKHLPFEEGWVNGKIERIDFSRRYRVSGPKATGKCSFNQTEVVTGLPVSAHDHSVNKLEFTPDGRLLITIGGFTNGGISIPGRKRVAGDPPDDSFGGVGSNPFSAAIVSCPVHTITRITYDNYTDPEKAKVVDGKSCFVYASGIRNSFGMTLHTNGHLYVTDNGGSRGNGDFATDCDGGSIPATKQRDKLFRIQRGGYHGHPNLNRGECVHYPPDAVQPILGDIESSTDGVVEYRSNIFGGRLKGDLVLTKFATNKRTGRMSQVKLDGSGGVAAAGFNENLYGRSGLAVVEGPRGELVMPQVYQKGVLFVYPKIVKPKVTFVIGVLPRRGPARGGARVLVSGFGFVKNSTVWFGRNECGDVRNVSEWKLICTTPAGQSNELVSVVVEGATGRSPSFGSDYWYF